MPLIYFISVKKTKGFTLIELLVVIAIIGMLSAVVLASLNTARSKAGNTAIRTNMASIRAQAELYYDTSPTGYLGVCSDARILSSITATNNASGGTIICNNSATAWAVSSPLRVSEGSNFYWCVDGSGAARAHATAIGTATVCP